MSQGELVSAEAVSRCQTPDFVVDIARQFLALAGGPVAVEVEVQGLSLCDWQGVVQVDVLLLEVVINIGSRQATDEVVS